MLTQGLPFSAMPTAYNTGKRAQPRVRACRRGVSKARGERAAREHAPGVSALVEPREFHPGIKIKGKPIKISLAGSVRA